MARLLADRIDRAMEAYRTCRLCPRDCGVDRSTDVAPAGAFCRLGSQAYVYKELFSHGEEAAISPTYLVDLGGCSLRCVFCSEWAWVVEPRHQPAVVLDGNWFGPRVAACKAKGARTLSFVGGDPTVSVLGVLRALAAVAEADWLPVVWNCNGWTSDLALDLLDGVVATWLVDVKFGNAACARRLSGAGQIDSQAELDRTLRAAAEQGRRRPLAEQHLPPLVVRHLVMPGHLQCCTKPVLDWLAREHPEAVVNLMTTYVPSGPAAASLAKAPELARFSTGAAAAPAIAYARGVVRALWVDGRVG